VLASPVLGPLAREAVARLDPGDRPEVKLNISPENAAQNMLPLILHIAPQDILSAASKLSSHVDRMYITPFFLDRHVCLGKTQDVVPPISTLPGLGPLRIPSPVPIPNFARLYFR